jgi:predicted RND superfamily exporter protein
VKRPVELILAHPFLVLGIFLLASAALGWQARHFEIDASADTLLTKNNEHYIQTQLMSERFSPQEFLLVVYRPNDQPVLSRQTFNNLSSIADDLRQIERVESVRSILNVPLLTLMENGLSSDNAADWTHEKQGFSIAQLKEAFRDNPVYEGLLINKAKTATALQVLFKPHAELERIQRQIVEIRKHALERELSPDEDERVAELEARAAPLEKELNSIRMDEIRNIRSMLTDYAADADIYLGGVHLLGYQLIQIIKQDLILFGGIIAGMICLVLLFLFKKLRWILIPVICCSSSVLLTIGLFGLLGLKTTVISSNFIALQLILTLSIVIHLIVQYREYCVSHPDWNQPQLVHQTLSTKAKPCFYAGLTTSVGFASLLFTGVQPVVSFGWMMIIAMAFSIGVSLTLFPALMALFPREGDRYRHKLAGAALTLSTHIARRWTLTTLLFSGASLVFCIGGLFLLTVENSFINYFRESTDVHRELSFIDQEMGGSTPLDIIITLPEGNKDQGNLVIQAQTVQQLQRIHALLQEHKGMGKLLSIVNFTEVAREINDGKPLTEYELTGLYRTMSRDLREGLLGSFFSPEHSQIRISARIKDATEGLSRADLMADIKDDMADLDIPPNRYLLTSLFVLYQDILQRLFRSQILALGLVYIALAITFYIIFRSLRVMLITITPNILSTVGVLGIMGWLRIPLDLMTITIASIAMGIAVDDTIHYTHRYLEEVKNAPGDQAVQNSNFSVGYAVIYTSVIIILGFSLLAFSDFIPSAQFGLLTSLAMAMALVWNLTLLPVLLARFLPGTQA